MFRRFVALFALMAVGLLATVELCCAGPAEDLAQARDMYVAGEFDTALKQLGAIANDDPAVFAEALKLSAYCYRAKANPSKALESFLKLSSSYPKSSAITPDVEDNILALGYWAKPEAKEALSCYRSMAAKYPDDAVIWRYLASDVLRNQGSDAEALIELLKAYDPPASKVNRLWEAKVNVRMYATSLSEFDKAIAAAKMELSKEPEDRFLWKYVLGYGYLCTGKYPEAITELDTASQLVEFDKKYTKQGRIWRSVKYALGCAYEKNKAYDKALPLYKEVAAKYPGFWRGQYGVFVCLAKQDELSQASAYINKVCSEQPEIKDKLRQLTTSYMLSEME